MALKIPAAVFMTETQSVIVEVRAANQFAGWQCPESVRIYQLIAWEVQRSLDWHGYSETTKQSMNDYLEICLDVGDVASIDIEKTKITVDPKTSLRHVEMLKRHADRQSIAIARAINKISDPVVQKKVLELKMVSCVQTEFVERLNILLYIRGHVRRSSRKVDGTISEYVAVVRARIYPFSRNAQGMYPSI